MVIIAILGQLLVWQDPNQVWGRTTGTAGQIGTYGDSDPSFEEMNSYKFSPRPLRYVCSLQEM